MLQQHYTTVSRIGHTRSNVRIHRCECGCVLDRDENAAINILARIAPATHNADSSRVSKSPRRKPKV